jgi:ketosteroid isomerase-like protein
LSGENLELMLRGVDAWNRGDLDWILDHTTEDFEFRPTLDFFDLDPIYDGPDGWRAFWRTRRDASASVTMHVERIEDLGDHTFVVVTFDGVGRGRGASVSMAFGQIWALRDGLAARIDVLHPQEALKAAGLRE